MRTMRRCEFVIPVVCMFTTNTVVAVCNNILCVWVWVCLCVRVVLSHTVYFCYRIDSAIIINAATFNADYNLWYEWEPHYAISFHTRTNHIECHLISPNFPSIPGTNAPITVIRCAFFRSLHNFFFNEQHLLNVPITTYSVHHYGAIEIVEMFFFWFYLTRFFVNLAFYVGCLFFGLISNVYDALALVVGPAKCFVVLHTHAHRQAYSKQNLPI